MFASKKDLYSELWSNLYEISESGFLLKLKQLYLNLQIQNWE